jgi:hypothetical protein
MKHTDLNLLILLVAFDAIDLGPLGILPHLHELLLVYVVRAKK